MPLLINSWAVWFYNYLSWINHIDAVAKKARQCLCFSRRLETWRISKGSYQFLQIRHGKHPIHLLQTLLRQLLCPKPQKAAELGISFKQSILYPIYLIYSSKCLRNAANMIMDHSRAGHSLFSPLPSGRWYKSLKTLPPDLRIAPSPLSDSWMLRMKRVHYVQVAPLQEGCGGSERVNRQSEPVSSGGICCQVEVDMIGASKRFLDRHWICREWRDMYHVQ